MTDDDLRAALAAADPAGSADLDPLTSPRARELLERAMTSDLSTPIAPSPTEPEQPAPTHPGKGHGKGHDKGADHPGKGRVKGEDHPGKGRGVQRGAATHPVFSAHAWLTAAGLPR